jgi:hypothetical protein
MEKDGRAAERGEGPSTVKWAAEVGVVYSGRNLLISIEEKNDKNGTMADRGYKTCTKSRLITTQVSNSPTPAMIRSRAPAPSHPCARESAHFRELDVERRE